MAKISLNISDELNIIIREYAESNDLTLTDACTALFKQALQSNSTQEEEYTVLQEEYELLQKKNEELERELDDEKQARLEDYKSLIAQNIETNRNLLELMKADRILQIEQKEEPKTFLQRVKMLFSSSNKNINSDK